MTRHVAVDLGSEKGLATSCKPLSILASFWTPILSSTPTPSLSGSFHVLIKSSSVLLTARMALNLNCPSFCMRVPCPSTLAFFRPADHVYLQLEQHVLFNVGFRGWYALTHCRSRLRIPARQRFFSIALTIGCINGCERACT